MVKCTPRVLFYVVLKEITWEALQKNTQQFQALSGLKCCTVGNLDSWRAFVIMLLGFTHFFEDKVKNGENFRTSNNFDLGTPCIAIAENKRP